MLQGIKRFTSKTVLAIIFAVLTLAFSVGWQPQKASAYTCGNGFVRLYDYHDYWGRSLTFYDRGYWQNLWLYDFDDKTSSYWNNSDCWVRVAQYADGGGYQEWLPPGAYNNLGWDDNFYSSIYIY